MHSCDAWEVPWIKSQICCWKFSSNNYVAFLEFSLESLLINRYLLFLFLCLTNYLAVCYSRTYILFMQEQKLTHNLICSIYQKSLEIVKTMLLISQRFLKTANTKGGTLKQQWDIYEWNFWLYFCRWYSTVL